MLIRPIIKLEIRNYIGFGGIDVRYTLGGNDVSQIWSPHAKVLVNGITPKGFYTRKSWEKILNLAENKSDPEPREDG